MSRPDLPPLSPETAALLAVERTRAVPSDMRDRVALRLAAILGPDGGDGGDGPVDPSDLLPGGDGGSSAAAAAASAGGTAGGTGILGALAGASKPLIAVVALTIGAAGGAGVQKYFQGADRAEVTIEPRINEVAPARPASAVEEPDVAAPVPAPTTARPSSAPSTSSVPREAEREAPRASPLAQEQSLIERARSALARGRAREALDALSAHARRFPDGEMKEEREGLRIQALAAAGDVDAARLQADEFRARYPRSVLQPSLD